MNLDTARRFVDGLRQDIPLAGFMGLEAVAADDRSLTLRAPLAPNVNDKGTAFAGSLASLSTVTGWALLMLWAHERLGPCLVAVSHSELRYRHPVMQDFTATATLPDDEALTQLCHRIASHGRGRVTLSIRLDGGEAGAVTQTATYAVWPAPAD